MLGESAGIISHVAVCLRVCWGQCGNVFMVNISYTQMFWPTSAEQSWLHIFRDVGMYFFPPLQFGEMCWTKPSTGYGEEMKRQQKFLNCFVCKLTFFQKQQNRNNKTNVEGEGWEDSRREGDLLTGMRAKDEELAKRQASRLMAGFTTHTQRTGLNCENCCCCWFRKPPPVVAFAPFTMCVR